MVEPQYVLDHAGQGLPLLQQGFDIGEIAFEDLPPGNGRSAAFAIDAGIHFMQHPGVGKGFAAEHDPGHVFQVFLAFVEAAYPAVENNRRIRVEGLQSIGPVVMQRGDLAVLFRTQALQPGLARVQVERIDAGLDLGFDKGLQFLPAVLLVHAGAMLDGNRQGHRVFHRTHAVGHPPGFAHQAGAEGTGLHPVGGAAHIEVDLVVTESLADARGRCQLCRIGTAQLQDHRMFGGVEAEQSLPIAVLDRSGGDHLREQQHAMRKQAQEIARMPIGAIDHRGDAETTVERGHERVWNGTGGLL